MYNDYVPYYRYQNGMSVRGADIDSESEESEYDSQYVRDLLRKNHNHNIKNDNDNNNDENDEIDDDSDYDYECDNNDGYDRSDYARKYDDCNNDYDCDCDYDYDNNPRYNRFDFDQCDDQYDDHIENDQNDPNEINDDYRKYMSSKLFYDLYLHFNKTNLLKLEQKDKSSLSTFDLCMRKLPYDVILKIFNLLIPIDLDSINFQNNEKYFYHNPIYKLAFTKKEPFTEIKNNVGHYFSVIFKKNGKHRYYITHKFITKNIFVDEYCDDMIYKYSEVSDDSRSDTRYVSRFVGKDFILALLLFFLEDCDQLMKYNESTTRILKYY